jgi:protein-tyrosine phosphatase
VTAAGMEFLNLPTPDRGTPAVCDFRTLLNALEAALRAGKHVVVHCRMGIGRSSVVAAGLLMAEGVPHATAWATVARARGLEVPDTAEQKSWLEAVMAGG